MPPGCENKIEKVGGREGGKDGESEVAASGFEGHKKDKKLDLQTDLI